MKYNIEALKRKMLVKYPFFGSVISGVRYKERRDIETAATDGKIIYYNPDFLEKLTVDEQIFILAHEVCHIAFNHILRSEKKDKDIWNMATDAVINQFLKRDGLKMVKGVIDIADAINYDAEQLYNKMIKEQTPKITGHDTHCLWKKTVNNYKKGQDKSEIEKKQEELGEKGEKAAFKKNSDKKKQQLEELKKSIAKKASIQGTITKSKIRKITNIGIEKPLIDWRYILREEVTYDVDWSYRNATLEYGVLTANLEDIPIPKTEILLDTSGSINEVLLKNFLRECKNILQQSRVKVGCFDTKFYGFYDIRTEEDIENMQFKGGGGTDFNVAINAFSRRTENKIIFTDGYALMPDMPLDAIWIVFGNKKIKPKGGRVINITGEQLDKLYSCEMNISNKGRTR